MWKRIVEQETNAGGKTWCEVKRLANNKNGWKYITVALCFTAKRDSNEIDDDVNDDGDEYYVNMRCFKSSVMLYSVDS